MLFPVFYENLYFEKWNRREFYVFITFSSKTPPRGPQIGVPFSSFFTPWAPVGPKSDQGGPKGATVAPKSDPGVTHLGTMGVHLGTKSDHLGPQSAHLGAKSAPWMLKVLRLSRKVLRGTLLLSKFDRFVGKSTLNVSG